MVSLFGCSFAVATHPRCEAAAMMLPRFGATARPWSTIVVFYREFATVHPEFADFCAFVEQIAESPYPAAGLSGLTSMFDLIVGPSSKTLDNPHLRITFDPVKRLFELTYYDGSLKPWARTATPDETFFVVERFLLKRARWFRKTSV